MSLLVYMLNNFFTEGRSELFQIVSEAAVKKCFFCRKGSTGVKPSTPLQEKIRVAQQKKNIRAQIVTNAVVFQAYISCVRSICIISSLSAFFKTLQHT